MGKASRCNLTGRNINKETLCKQETNFGSRGYPVSPLPGFHSKDSAQGRARSAPSPGRPAHARPRYPANCPRSPGGSPACEHLQMGWPAGSVLREGLG